MDGGAQELITYISPAELSGLADVLTPREKSVLETINQKVAGASSLEEILRFVFDSTRSLYPCDRIGLSFIEEEGRRLTSHSAVADYEPLLLEKGYSADLTGSSLKTIIDLGMPRIINDLEEYLKQNPHSEPTLLILEEGVRANLTCPLSVNGRPIGLFFRSSRKPRVYEKRHALLHLAIAERLSQAAEKAHQIERLENTNRDYLEMLGFVSHELKNPLASIMLTAKMFTEGYLGEITEEQREKMDRIIARSEYLLNLVREYLDLSKMEGTGARPYVEETPDFVRQVIEPSIDMVLPQIESQTMSVKREFPGTPLAVQCDPNLMKIVLTNLVGNAAKYGKKGGEIRIRAETISDALHVSVRNEGPGFPQEEHSKLFKKFSRLRKPELMEQKGTGVGLYTSWRVIQMHGGRITAHSEEGQWAEFEFSIPLSSKEIQK